MSCSIALLYSLETEPHQLLHECWDLNSGPPVCTPSVLSCLSPKSLMEISYILIHLLLKKVYIYLSVWMLCGHVCVYPCVHQARRGRPTPWV